MHYVMSDIHGQYDDYQELLEQINLQDNDILYILGDAIDRGPQPIDVLMDIMSRKNAVFLIGNHEHMMVQAIQNEDNDQMYSWTLNGADKTIMQWDILSDAERRRILEYLNECPVAVPSLYVAGRNYYLAHATHYPFAERGILRYCDIDPYKVDRYVWNRAYQNPDVKRLEQAYGKLYRAFPNTTLIIGHTPVSNCSYGIVRSNGSCKISRACSGHLINVDCGGARGRPLGCLRLEDGKEFYATRKKRRE